LRQARVHVVEMRHAEYRGERHAEPTALFVRVHRVVFPTERTPARRHEQRGVERQLLPRGPDADAVDEGWARRPKHAKAGQTDVVPEWICDKIDRMAEL